MTKVALNFKQKNKGQSFLEMTIVLGVLLLLLTGMVEFGNLLNQYIGLVDGVREGARFGSNNDPFLIDGVGGGYSYPIPQQTFFEKIYLIIEGNTAVPIQDRTSAISPIELKPLLGGVRTNGEAVIPDDIMVTFYAVKEGSILGTYFPSPRSKYGNYSTSRLSSADIISQLDSNAPSTGILVVEIFYNYHQLLSLPFFTTIIADPIPLHTYAVMPLAGAEATPAP